MWKFIPEFGEAYSINEQGQIRSNYRRTISGRTIHEKLLSPNTAISTIYMVTLYKPTGTKRKVLRAIARLVASVFLPEYTPTCVVRYKDGNHANYCADNLICTTRKQCAENGTLAIKKCNINRRIPVQQIDVRTGKILGTFASMYEASKIAKVSPGAIHASIRRRSPTTKGHLWIKIHK